MRPLWLLFVASALVAGCPKKKKKASQDEICRKGCAFRVACAEDLGSDRAVSDAVRARLRRKADKERKVVTAYCVKQCRAGRKKFRAYARCGYEASDCEAYWACEKKKLPEKK